MSLLQVTLRRPLKRQRARASWAVFGKWGPERDTCGDDFVVSRDTGRSTKLETGLLKVGWHLGQHGPVLVETRREQTGQM